MISQSSILLSRIVGVEKFLHVSRHPTLSSERHTGGRPSKSPNNLRVVLAAVLCLQLRERGLIGYVAGRVYTPPRLEILEGCMRVTSIMEMQS